MVPPPNEPMIPETKHKILKTAFLYSPLGENDQELVSKLSKETGLDTSSIVDWFQTMRERLNIAKFITKDEDVIEREEPMNGKMSNDGKSPLDCLVYQEQKTKDSDIGNATYNDDTTNIVDDDNISSLCEESIKTYEETGAREDRNEVKAAEDSVVEIKQEHLEPAQIKTEPSCELRVKPKQEMLTTEEKAEKYDRLKAEMERLQKQMEEMKKRFETPSPTVHPGILMPVSCVKQEPVSATSDQRPVQNNPYPMVPPPSLWQQPHPQYPPQFYQYQQYPPQPYVYAYNPQLYSHPHPQFVYQNYGNIQGTNIPGQPRPIVSTQASQSTAPPPSTNVKTEPLE